MVDVAGIEVRAARARMRSNRRPAKKAAERPERVAAAKLAKVVAKLERVAARAGETIDVTIVAAAAVGPTSGETAAARPR